MLSRHSRATTAGTSDTTPLRIKPLPPNLNDSSVLFPSSRNAPPVTKEALSLAHRRRFRKLVPLPPYQPDSKSTTATTAGTGVASASATGDREGGGPGQSQLRELEQLKEDLEKERNDKARMQRELREEITSLWVENEVLRKDRHAVQQRIDEKAQESRGSEGLTDDGPQTARRAPPPGPEEAIEIERWLSSVALFRAIVDRVPSGTKEDALAGLKNAKKVDVELAFRGLEGQLVDLVFQAAQDLRDAERAAADRCTECNAKFSSEGCVVGSYGSMADFNSGLEKRIGLPSLQVAEAMEREHCHSADSDCEFRPSNYGRIMTTPRREYTLMIHPPPDRPSQHDVVHHRRVLPLVAFLKLLEIDGEKMVGEAEKDVGRSIVVKDALALCEAREEMDDDVVERVARMAVRGETFGVVASQVSGWVREEELRALCDKVIHRLRSACLTREEVLALRLYSGPLFVKYNAILRQYPRDVCEGTLGNGYTTTLHAICSALLKVQGVTSVSEGRKVYRGMSGLLLPEQFHTPDDFGCRGGVELGFLSTTKKRDVAIQYIGGRSHPLIFEISVGQVDRGASVMFVSQYPLEEEILFPMLSNLEVTGSSWIERTAKGPVCVVPVRINANAKGATLTDLLSRRKMLHVSMLENAVLGVASELRDIQSSTRYADRVTADWSAREDNFDKKLVEGIVSECNKVLKAYQGKPADWYNHDAQYALAMKEAVDLRGVALSKMNFWMDDASTLAKQVVDLPMQEVHVEQMRKKVCAKNRDLACCIRARDKEAAQDVVFHVCMIKGLFGSGSDVDVAEGKDGVGRNEKGVAERKVLIDQATNSLGEPPIIVAAASGDLASLRLLVQARADVNATNQKGANALMLAAYMGYDDCVEELLHVDASAGARARTDEAGNTCLHWAARGGHLSVVEALVAGVGQGCVMQVNARGESCLLCAAAGGFIDVVSYLASVGGKELVCLPDVHGKTPLTWAAMGGHSDLIEILHREGGEEYLYVKDKEGMTCLHRCAWPGLQSPTSLLCELGGQRLIESLDNNGRTCLHLVCGAGHPGVIKFLLQTPSKGFLLAAERFEGVDEIVEQHGKAATVTCLHYAARWGWMEALDVLIDDGGLGPSDVRTPNRSGRTSLHLAAGEGETEMCLKLVDIAGDELLFIKDSDGKTCDQVASERGHISTQRKLEELMQIKVQTRS